jgi:hypothetical protein
LALAGLLTVMHCCLEVKSTIGGRAPHMLYMLATGMRPRMLMTIDEDGKLLPVTVRVGQAVDVVAQVRSTPAHPPPSHMCEERRWCRPGLRRHGGGYRPGSQTRRRIMAVCFVALSMSCGVCRCPAFGLVCAACMLLLLLLMMMIWLLLPSSSLSTTSPLSTPVKYPSSLLDVVVEGRGVSPRRCLLGVEPAASGFVGRGRPEREESLLHGMPTSYLLA